MASDLTEVMMQDEIKIVRMIDSSLLKDCCNQKRGALVPIPLECLKGLNDCSKGTVNHDRIQRRLSINELLVHLISYLLFDQ
jgi:hypothetical protein